MIILTELISLRFQQTSFVKLKKITLVLIMSHVFILGSTQNETNNNALPESEKSQIINVNPDTKKRRNPRSELTFRNKRRQELEAKLKLDQNWDRTYRITQVLNSNEEAEFYINHSRRNDSEPIEIYDSTFNKIELSSNFYLRNSFKDNISYPYVVLFNENREFGIYNLVTRDFSIKAQYRNISFIDKNYVRLSGSNNKSSSEPTFRNKKKFDFLRKKSPYAIADPKGDFKTEFKYSSIHSPIDGVYLCSITSKDSTIKKVKELSVQSGVFENSNTRDYFDEKEIIVLNADFKQVNDKRYIHFEKVFYWNSALYEEEANFIATELKEDGLFTYILDTNFNILVEIPYGQFYSRVKGNLDGLMQYISKDSTRFYLVNDYTTERILEIPFNFKPIPKKNQVYYKLSGRKSGYHDQVIYDQTGKKLFKCPDNKYLICEKDDDYFLAVTKVSQDSHVEKFAYLYDLEGNLLIWHGKFKYDEILKKRYILGTKGEVFYLNK